MDKFTFRKPTRHDRMFALLRETKDITTAVPTAQVVAQRYLEKDVADQMILRGIASLTPLQRATSERNKRTARAILFAAR